MYIDLKKIKNWWYYDKWYVLISILILIILFQRLGSAFGWFSPKPDLQIAYIGKIRLPEDTTKAIRQAFVTFAEDYNHDGKIIIDLHQYISGNEAASDDESFYSQYASEVEIIGDINDCESYFFLLEDPDDFQRRFQILAMPDGTCPADTDFSIKEKGFFWKDCPALADQELGSFVETSLGYSQTGSNQEILSLLFVSRRCFYDEKTVKYPDKCDHVWKKLIQSL